MARPFKRGPARNGDGASPLTDPITAPVGAEPAYAPTSDAAISDAAAAGMADRAVSSARRAKGPSNAPEDGFSETGVTRPALVRPSHRSVNDEATTSTASAAPELDDAHVEALKRGDTSSWEAAYLAYGRALMGYLMLRLDNRDDASEALSETFTRAIDKASSFRGDAFAFRAWLFSIARNASTDQHRRRARVVVLADHPEQEDRSQPSGDDIAILHEDVTAVRRGFSRLSPADREVLWLRVCSGLSAADVGAVLGKRAGAVRMQQLRALETLRGQVDR